MPIGDVTSRRAALLLVASASIAPALAEERGKTKKGRPMLMVTMMYPAGTDAHFDHSYYMNSHMPRVRRLWGPLGMQGDQVLRGLPGPDGAPPPIYVLMTMMTFTSMESFNEAVAQHGDELYGDVPNFTAITPVRMFGGPAA